MNANINFNTFLKVIYYNLGFNLFKSRNLNQNIMSYVFRSLIIIFQIYFIFDAIYRTKFKGIKKDLMRISYILKCCYFLITYIMFILKFKKIIKIYDTIEEKLDENMKIESNKLSVKLLLLYLGATILNFTGFASLLVLRSKSSVIEFLLDLLCMVIWSIYCFGWIIAIILFYLMICNRIHILEVNLFIQMSKQQQQLFKKTIDFIDFYQNLQFLTELKYSVNNVMGFLPFLWLLHSFVACCLRLTYTALNPDRFDPGVLFESTLFGIYYSLFVITIDLIQSKRPDFQKLFNPFDINFPINSNQIRVLFLQKLIENYNSICFMAFNIYKLENKLLLSFSSSVITFTVMLIQIIEQLSKS